MNDKILTIWDREEEATSPAESTIYWSGYYKKDNIKTIPNYLEQNADQLRARYLSFIHELGELNFLGKRLIDHLEVDKDFSFWWMTLPAEKSYLKSPRIFDCLRLLALDEQLNRIKPQTLKLVSGDNALADAINKCAESKGIHFEWDKKINQSGKMNLKNFYGRLPSTVRSIIFFLIHILSRWQLIKVRKKKWFSGNHSIFFFSYFVHLDSQSCENGNFYSHQWGALPSTLYDKGLKLNFIHHFLQSPDMPNTKKGIKWVTKFNRRSDSQGLHSFLDSWLSLKVCLNALFDFFTISIKMIFLQSSMTKAIHKIPYNYLWPLLERDWNNSIHGPLAIQNTLFLRLIDSAVGNFPKQSIGLYLLEGQCWERAFIHYWRKNGHGRLIGFCHATVSYWYLMYFNDQRTLNSNAKNAMPKPDNIAVNGKAMRNIMVNAGYQPETLIDVEAIRYLHINEVKNKFHLKAVGKKRLLALGDYMPDVTKSLLFLLNQLDKSFLLKYDIFFKRHPVVDPINKKLYPNLHFQEINSNLNEILPNVDIVLSTINTAAAIESFAVGLPVITMLDSNNFNSSPLRGENGAVFISTPLELKTAIENLLNQSFVQKQNDYFWVDPELPRWKSLLGLDQKYLAKKITETYN